MEYIVHIFHGIQVSRLRADGPCASIALSRCMKKYPTTWQGAEDYMIVDWPSYVQTDSADRGDARLMRDIARARVHSPGSSFRRQCMAFAGLPDVMNPGII